MSHTDHIASRQDAVLLKLVNKEVNYLVFAMFLFFIFSYRRNSKLSKMTLRRDVIFHEMADGRLVDFLEAFLTNTFKKIDIFSLKGLSFLCEKRRKSQF